MITLPNKMPVSDSRNFTFRHITDHVRPGQWVEWEVGFEFNGLPCTGNLMASPFFPVKFDDLEIENCEVDF